MWSVLQIVARNVTSIGSSAVLARLLTPNDYGLMGVVATLTALLLVFSDMGLSWATIQKRELTSIQVSNLFWINALAGGTFWLLCIVAAPYVAELFGRTELNAVVVVPGANFLLRGIAVLPLALLQRRMSFRLAGSACPAARRFVRMRCPPPRITALAAKCCIGRSASRGRWGWM